MRTISATADTADEKTSLSISGGRGNGTVGGEIHVIARAIDEKGETQTIAAWFKRDEILDALHDADEDARRPRVRLTEPAAAE